MNIQALIALRIPFAVLPLLLRLAKTLIRDAPDTEDKLVIRALERLEAEIERVEFALEQRLRTQSPALVARELEFDRAVDSLWILLREVTHGRAIALSHPGLDFLSPERQAAVDLAKLRGAAAAAETVHDALFVPAGTAFTKQKMVTQVEAMATLLRLIDADDHEQAIGHALGPNFVELLRTCQAQYEELVHTRMRRETSVDDDFRALASDLRWRMDRYKAAVESLYDEDDPDSFAPVEDALRALVLTAKALRRSSTSAEALDGELDEVLVDLDFELEGEGEGEGEDEAQSETEPVAEG